MNLPHPCINGVYINQPKYLTNNWRSFQANSDFAYSKYLKVYGGVVTLICAAGLLRCRVEGIPDGFYIFEDDGSLRPAENLEVSTPYYYRSSNCFDKYPDAEAIRPVFSRIAWSPPIPRTEVRICVDFLNHVRNVVGSDDNRAMVFFEDRALICAQNTDIWLGLPFEAPGNIARCGLQANTLRHIMTDMLRYEHVFIGRDSMPTADRGGAPLVIGLDWSCCGLVKPSV